MLFTRLWVEIFSRLPLEPAPGPSFPPHPGASIPPGSPPFPPPPPNGLLHQIMDWTVAAMDHLGAFGAGVMMALETFFPFIPSELILPLAGFTVSKGNLSFLAVIFWCTLGAMSTAWIYWGLGWWLGPEKARRLLAKLPLVSEEDVLRSERWFEKHGAKAVFFARMLPVLRGFISVPAGVVRMPFWRFTLISTAGSLIWNLLLTYAGYWLGERWELVEHYVGKLTIWFLILCALVVVIWVVKRLYSNRQNSTKKD